MTTPSQTPWGTGLTVSGFVAAVTAAAIIVLSLGLLRVHPLLAVYAFVGLFLYGRPRKRKENS